jgi:sugar-specific transcriptional regulator TrmB
MEEELQTIGLNKNEAKIYLALNELGQTTIGDIAKKSKIHRTNVYDAIENLVSKGLVSYVIKDNTKYFETTDPQNLQTMIKEKEEIVTALLPRLDMMHKLAASSCDVQLQTGIQASKRAMDSFLEKNETIYVFGTPSIVGQLIGPFLSNFHKRRIQKKIIMKHIYNTDAFERIKFLKALPYTPVRILPAEYNSPVATNVVGDEVIIIHWVKDPIIIRIKNKTLADVYRKYFELLWKKAKSA